MENTQADDIPNINIRTATTDDVPEIKALVDIYAGKILLEKNLIDIYEALQEYVVVESQVTLLDAVRYTSYGLI